MAGNNLFQSTPSHGGRQEPLAREQRQGSFNPRPRTEGDGLLWLAGCALYVSIHALARRATFDLKEPGSPKMFQSTPSHGGRPSNPEWIFTLQRFQSTPSHGGRHACQLMCERVFAFQSTPSHGGRLLYNFRLNT